jgi:AAA domain, putative AbiEii toxin, Type IV TA system
MSERPVIEAWGLMKRFGGVDALGGVDLCMPVGGVDLFDLSDAAGRTARIYSGGMRRRLDVAASLVAQPAVLFLDEPTTGLEPRGRRGLWQLLRELAGQGTSILLTTQYLEEADSLADQIVVLDYGTVIAAGTADRRAARAVGPRLRVGRHRRPLGGDSVDIYQFHLRPSGHLPRLAAGFAKLNSITVTVDALRALCLGGPTATAVWQAIAWIGALLVVTIPAAIWCYRRTTAA